jgi:hypothetical protein
MLESIALIIYLALCYVAGYLLGAAIAEWLTTQGWYLRHIHG